MHCRARTWHRTHCPLARVGTGDGRSDRGQNREKGTADGEDRLSSGSTMDEWPDARQMTQFPNLQAVKGSLKNTVVHSQDASPGFVATAVERRAQPLSLPGHSQMPGTDEVVTNSSYNYHEPVRKGRCL